VTKGRGTGEENTAVRRKHGAGSRPQLEENLGKRECNPVGKDAERGQRFEGRAGEKEKNSGDHEKEKTIDRETKTSTKKKAAHQLKMEGARVTASN